MGPIIIPKESWRLGGQWPPPGPPSSQPGAHGAKGNGCETEGVPTTQGSPGAAPGSEESGLRPVGETDASAATQGAEAIVCALWHCLDTADVPGPLEAQLDSPFNPESASPGQAMGGPRGPRVSKQGSQGGRSHVSALSGPLGVSDALSRLRIAGPRVGSGPEACPFFLPAWCREQRPAWSSQAPA